MGYKSIGFSILILILQFFKKSILILILLLDENPILILILILAISIYCCNILICIPDSECPRICVNVGWWVSVSKQFVIGQSETNIHFKNVRTNRESFRDGDPPPHIHTNSGTLRIHEKIISK